MNTRNMIMYDIISAGCEIDIAISNFTGDIRIGVQGGTSDGDIKE